MEPTVQKLLSLKPHEEAAFVLRRRQRPGQGLQRRGRNSSFLCAGQGPLSHRCGRQPLHRPGRVLGAPSFWAMRTRTYSAMCAASWRRASPLAHPPPLETDLALMVREGLFLHRKDCVSSVRGPRLPSAPFRLARAATGKKSH